GLFVERFETNVEQLDDGAAAADVELFEIRLALPDTQGRFLLVVICSDDAANADASNRPRRPRLPARPGSRSPSAARRRAGRSPASRPGLPRRVDGSLAGDRFRCAETGRAWRRRRRNRASSRARFPPCGRSRALAAPAGPSAGPGRKDWRGSSATAAQPSERRCDGPHCDPPRSGSAVHRYARAARLRRDATARFSWLCLVLRLFGDRAHDCFHIRRSRCWPVGQRPWLALGIEGAETADLRNVLAETVTEFLQGPAGFAADTALDQLHDHDHQQYYLGQLPDEEEHQHPDRPKDQRLALGSAFRMIH